MFYKYSIGLICFDSKAIYSRRYLWKAYLSNDMFGQHIVIISHFQYELQYT